MSKWCIRHQSGSYFVAMAPIGPMFGAAKEKAAVFKTKKEALLTTAQHWAFVMCTLEKKP